MMENRAVSPRSEHVSETGGESSPRRRLLLVNQAPFGHQTGPFYYCHYLRHHFDITYICWDYNFERKEMPGIDVRYVSRDGSKPVRLGRFIRTVLSLIDSGDYDVVFVVYFSGSSLLRLLRPDATYVLDVRTGSERRNRFMRRMENLIVALESRLYRNVTVLSASMIRALHLKASNCHVTPLGAEPFALRPKSFDAMHLLYVGTLNNRDLEKTIDGFDRFWKEYRTAVDLSYEIVGDGPPVFVDRVRRAVENAASRATITLHGRVPYADLLPYFERCNIGIAFIPITEYFNCQPSTKVFEYLLAGMPVLATATDEVRSVILPENGVLINDTAGDVYEGLKRLHSNLASYRSNAIRERSRQYSWESIVQDNILPYLSAVVLNGRGGRENATPDAVQYRPFGGSRA